jgi:hypothetical protein
MNVDMKRKYEGKKKDEEGEEEEEEKKIISKRRKVEVSVTITVVATLRARGGSSCNISVVWPGGVPLEFLPEHSLHCLMYSVVLFTVSSSTSDYALKKETTYNIICILYKKYIM